MAKVGKTSSVEGVPAVVLTVAIASVAPTRSPTSRAIHPESTSTADWKWGWISAGYWGSRYSANAAPSSEDPAVPYQQYQALAGHKLSGVDDYHIRRNPRMVELACRAIERHYFTKK